MSLLFTLASAFLSVILLITLVLLARGRDRDRLLARIILPQVIIVLAAQMALQHWSVASFALLALLIISAGILAVQGRGRDREHRTTWIALAVFAAAGLLGGFGVLAQGLCVAGDTYNCAGMGSDLLAAGGWAIALAAYIYLAWGALKP